jgi:hypothetical protein
METGTFGVLVNPNAWVVSQGNDTLKTTAGILTTPYNYTSPDYRPAPGSIALSGASFTDSAISASTGTAAVSVLATIPASACIGNGTTTSSYSFAASTTVSPEYCSLMWTVPSGVSISNSTAVNPTFTVSTIGNFSINLIVTNANGTSTVTNAIVTNTCSNVGLNEVKNAIGVVSLFPNPTSHVANLNVQSQNVTSLNVNVYDITGKLVMSPVQNSNLNIGDNKFELNTSNLQNGIYFVTLSTVNGKETVKLVVNK